MMERLWTPWRMQYVTGEDAPSESGNRADIFLHALADAGNPDSLVVHVGNHGFIIMNLFPYNTGHMMVVPKRRVSDLTALRAEERGELFELVSSAAEIASAVLRCDGFNIGLNIGSVAGAGIADHLHIHVVPRWLGDANFMPITANTMVLPELLPATTARLKGEFASREARYNVPEIRATAGALVYLPERNQFIMRKSRDGSIVLPKGHIEDGETAAEAAVREVSEETGFGATITNWLGVDTFEHKDRSFHTVYFFAVGTWTAEVDDHLDTDTILVNVDDAAGRASFQSIARLVHRGVELVLRSANDDSDSK